MKKSLILSFLLLTSISLLSGFTLNRSSQKMTIKMHVKDLPEDGLLLIGPSNPSFAARFATFTEGQSSEAVDIFKPFSAFLENNGKQTVVAYMIQWCFTGVEGTHDCYRKAFAAPRALMEGERLAEDEELRSGKVRPGSAVFLSLVSPDGSGAFRVPMSREEGEQFKQGSRPERKQLLQRFGAELAKGTDVTISIDGAFFDDGTFVGDDTSGFFALINAQVEARQDGLNHVVEASTNAHKSRDDLFRDLEAIVNQQVAGLNSKATPTDYYDYYRKFYAAQILRSRRSLGDDEAVGTALQSLKKPWRMLAKKDKKNR